MASLSFKCSPTRSGNTRSLSLLLSLYVWMGIRQQARSSACLTARWWTHWQLRLEGSFDPCDTQTQGRMRSLSFCLSLCSSSSLSFCLRDTNPRRDEWHVRLRFDGGWSAAVDLPLKRGAKCHHFDLKAQPFLYVCVCSHAFLTCHQECHTELHTCPLLY